VIQISAVILIQRPQQVFRLDDEGEALALQADELRRQLEANEGLTQEERQLVAARLESIKAARQRAGARGAAAAAVQGRQPAQHHVVQGR
jgi:hypothetical protein